MMIGPVSRVNLLLNSISLSAIRKVNQAAGAASMAMRMRARRAAGAIQDAEFTARIRSTTRALDMYA